MTHAAAKQPVRDLLGFALPLVALLAIGGIGLWREQMAGAADQSRRLAWLANTAAGQAEALFAKERAEWEWTEARVAPDGKVTGRAWFDPAPMPQAAGPAAELMAGGRFDEVIERFPGALSVGGTPLGPQAAYRKLLAAPDSGVAVDAARKLRELAFAYPSVISPELMEAADAELQRRGLTDPTAEPWRGRWATIERIATQLDRVLAQPPQVEGSRIEMVDGTAWWIGCRTTAQDTAVLAFPLDRWLEETRTAWRDLPLETGTRVGLDSPEPVLALPAGTAGWPREGVMVAGGAVRVVATRDPAVLQGSTRVRIMLLGGVGLLAGGVMAVAWWRQRRALRMQRELIRQKDDFLSTVSHELRTPVAALQLLSENLVTGTVTEPAAIGSYHERLLHEARRLAATTEHLLDFALMERGHKNYRFSPLDLCALAEDVRMILHPLAVTRGITLEIAVAAITPPPAGDAEALRRVILNLGDNALKFSPADTRVEIALESGTAGVWTIRVADQGPGIPAHERARIFERFFRGGGVLDRKTRGTGIGLAVARHVVEGHGGRIELTDSSTAGSVFTCTLPCQPPDVFPPP